MKYKPTTAVHTSTRLNRTWRVYVGRFLQAVGIYKVKNMNAEQELKELMTLVEDFGETCISAGKADLVNSKETHAFTLDRAGAYQSDIRSRLRALLAERDALKEDAERWKEIAFGSSPFLGVVYVDDQGNERWLCEQDACDAVDAARKATK